MTSPKNPTPGQLDTAWFEMGDVRRRKFDSAVWVPLRAVLLQEDVGEYGWEGHRHVFFGAGSLAIPLSQRAAAEKLGWSEVGICHHHQPYVEGDDYIPVDTERHKHVGVSGVRLVFEQRGNRAERQEWHLNPDLAIGLGLKREGDEWLAIHEGYVPVVRLTRKEGRPIMIEIRAEYLKDYLCARQMALLLNTYRERRVVVADANKISWKGGEKSEVEKMDRWEGKVIEIHEGGMPYGGQTAFFHVARTDVDESDDVPTLKAPDDDSNTRSESWTRGDSGRKLFVVRGDLWRTEWIEPATRSTRVRQDEVESSISFIVDAAGTMVRAADLRDAERWLWFRPNVISALLAHRGGVLAWYTKDTGSVSCSPDYDVHFGLNDLGLVTVYAEDVARLPEWQQRIWAGSNVTPEGGVSAELLASQVKAEPANTQAPEAFLQDALDALSAAGDKACGQPIIRPHKDAAEILLRVHRFRSLDDPGFLALAKDLARLTADSIDATAIQKRLPPEKKAGSLKSLEALVAEAVGADKARALLGPLFAIYDLRLGDAHLPGDLEHARPLLRVNASSPHVVQGRDMLGACVSVLFAIASVIKRLPPAEGGKASGPASKPGT